MKSKSNYRRFATSAEQYVPRRAAVLTAGVVAAQCPPKRGCAMLKHRGFAAFALCVIECVIATGGLILSHSAQAADGALPKDRAAIEPCLKKQPDNRDACINVVYTPCTGTPEGGSTVGMEDCAARELAVWDERLNAAYRKLVNGDLGKTDALPENRPAENPRAQAVKGAVIIQDMEKSWIAFRARKCDVGALTAKGGTLARTIYSTCNLSETGRQALYLESLVDDLSSR